MGHFKYAAGDSLPNATATLRKTLEYLREEVWKEIFERIRAPVLVYFDTQNELGFHSKSRRYGLGAVLLDYRSRTLSAAETRFDLLTKKWVFPTVQIVTGQ